VRVPLLDLTRQHGRVREAVAARVRAVFESQQFILGRTVEDFEKAFCDSTGSAHAIGMSSGTDAQLAILMAMGIGPGNAVITTPYTFFATAGSIHRAGAEPVFVDIEPDTFHMDPARLHEYLQRLASRGDGQLITALGNCVRAIVPVHLFGSCCSMDALRDSAAQYGLAVIEDAAQAIGAEYLSRDGTSQAGTLGDAAFFSFFPTKNLGAAGDAGMAVCRSAALAEKLRLVRNHGMEERYSHCIVGGNFRLDAIQAAVLHAKLPFVREWNDSRRRKAARYATGLCDLADHLKLPAEPWKETGLANHHTWHQFVVRATRRDELLRHLAKAEVGYAVYYPLPLHLQECFAYLGYKEGDFPQAEHAAKEAVALPIFPELSDEEIDAVVRAIRSFYLQK
jgi:dTDP-4-amino-4,6-dideoxygalactose transaminase